MGFIAFMVVMFIIWVCCGGLKQFGNNKPESFEEINRKQLKGYEGTQYYKDQIEFAKKLDNKEL